MYRLARSLRSTIPALLAALILFAAPARAQTSADGDKPFPPFRIADNLYFVGTGWLGNYLVTTPQGHILINADFVESVPLIRASVEQLGFKFSDIRILLLSHAHNDHAAGAALIKQLTGAQYMVMDGDVPVVQSGGATDFLFGHRPEMRYPPAQVDRVLHDGDTVRLGDARLVAHLTAGHTRGNTTWSMRVTDRGRIRDALIIGSPNVNPGTQLVNNARYPTIAADYTRGFRTMERLPCEIFLGAHGGYFDLETKHAKLLAGDSTALVDPAGCRAYLAERETAFNAELAKQRAAARRARR